MARRKCSKCSSTKIIKKGQQQFQSRNCKYRFLNVSFEWWKRADEDNLTHKFTYTELEDKYTINAKRIGRQFDKLSLAELKNEFKDKGKFNLVFDVCHFKREFCLLLFRTSKRNIHNDFKDSEKIIYYEQALKEINQKHEFSSSTIDSGMRVIQLLESLFPSVPIQLCQFH